MKSTVILGKKNIFTFWNDPIEHAPLVVKMAMFSWSKIAGAEGFTLHLINESNVGLYEDLLPQEESRILRDFRKRFKPLEPHWSWTHYTDCLRLALIDEFGGVWADGTVLATKPLRLWLPRFDGLLLPRGGRLAHEMNSWFIVCMGKDELLTSWKRFFLRYCNNPKLRSQILSSTSKFSVDFWLKRLGNLHPFMTRIWFHPIVEKGWKIAPYFAIYYSFSLVLSKGPFRPLHECHLPLDIEAWLIFNKAGWLAPTPLILENRILNLPIIKLCYKEHRGVSDIASVPVGSMLDEIFSSVDTNWRSALPEFVLGQSDMARI